MTTNEGEVVEDTSPAIAITGSPGTWIFFREPGGVSIPSTEGVDSETDRRYQSYSVDHDIDDELTLHYVGYGRMVVDGIHDVQRSRASGGIWDTGIFSIRVDDIEEPRIYDGVMVEEWIEAAGITFDPDLAATARHP